VAVAEHWQDKRALAAAPPSPAATIRGGGGRVIPAPPHSRHPLPLTPPRARVKHLFMICSGL